MILSICDIEASNALSLLPFIFTELTFYSGWEWKYEAESVDREG